MGNMLLTIVLVFQCGDVIMLFFVSFSDTSDAFAIITGYIGNKSW
jgi:hypothetical protein